MKLIFRIAAVIILLGTTQLNAQQKSKQTQLMKTQLQPIEISSFELRLIMNEFFIHFSGVVEEGADSIRALAKDPRVKENALLWKMYAIPSAQRSIMVSDPFAAFTDAAVLSLQMLQFFETGEGQDLFGDWQFIAINKSRRLFEEMKRIGRGLSTDRDISHGKRLMENYARENPIRSLYFIRRSTLPLQAKLMQVEKIKLKALAENMSASFEELSTRLNLYTESLPKQIRWQSEYMIGQMASSPEIKERLDSLMIMTVVAQRMTVIAERMAIVAESAPSLVDDQRKAIMRDVGRERRIILDVLKSERIEISKELAQARDQLMDDIWNNVSLERLEAFEDAEGILVRSVELSFDKIDDLIVKIFKWILLSVGVLFVAALYRPPAIHSHQDP